MTGDSKKPDATAAVIDDEGGFDTEDLGWLTPQGDLMLTGRVKDTIMLSNGENIEPEPSEAACSRSPDIEQLVSVRDAWEKLHVDTVWLNGYSPNCLLTCLLRGNTVRLSSLLRKIAITETEKSGFQSFGNC